MRTKTLLKFVVFLICAPLVAVANVDVYKKHKVALIYHGPGACKECPETIADVLVHMGYKVHYIRPGQMNSNYFAGADLYVQPGGTDHTEDTLKALQSGEIDNLRSFISSGGSYLGVCAGAFLAAKMSEGPERLKAFGFLDIPFMVDEMPTSDPLVISTEWLGKKRFLYFQGGPSLGVEAPRGAEVIARYSNSGRIAAFISKFGNGLVGLIGPHPEADESWFKDDHLSLKHGLNRDLMKDFIQRIQ